MSVVQITSIGNFRPIHGFENYFVTERGVIYGRYSRHGKLLPAELVRPLIGWTMPKGYKCVTLCGENGARRSTLIHRIVLECFRGPCPDGLECRHLDGNPGNNELSNLKWGTAKENASDKKKRDTGIYGSRHPLAKLNEKGAAGARALAAIGWTHREIAELFHVTRSAISLVVRKKNWKHVRSHLMPRS